MIAIPNMEKPQSCWECRLMDGEATCLVIDEGIPLKQEGIYPDCPLIEIVTCGECKWFINQGEGNVGKCKYRTRPILYCLPTDFCSYGEKKGE